MFIILAAMILVIISVFPITAEAKSALYVIGLVLLLAQFLYWWSRHRMKTLMLQEALALADDHRAEFYINHVKQDSNFNLVEFLAKNKGRYRLLVEYEDVPEVYIQLVR